MKRADREMDETFAWKVFDKAAYAVLAMTKTDGNPYCIPVSPARDGTRVYFHCALHGLKTDCLELNPNVCMTAVGMAMPTLNEFSVEYESAVLDGEAVTIDDEQEKIEALRLICQRYTPSNMAHFDEAIARSLKITRIVRIDVKQITGKRKKYDSKGVEMKWQRMDE